MAVLVAVYCFISSEKSPLLKLLVFHPLFGLVDDQLGISLQLTFLWFNNDAVRLILQHTVSDGSLMVFHSLIRAVLSLMDF